MVRELDYKLFLAVSLANKNTNVIIAQHDYFNTHCSMFAGGIYIGKNCFKSPFLKNATSHSNNLVYVEELKNNDISVVYLDEEGAVWRGSEIAWANYMDARLRPDVLGKNDFVITWGSYQKKYYENKTISFPDSNIVAIGHPKYDLYKPRFRHFFKKEIDEIRAKYGPFILINTMTVWANGLTGLKETFRDGGEGWDNYSSNNEKRRIAFIDQWAGENKILVNFVKLVHKLSIVFPNKTFVLRPHPGEDPEFYKIVFSGIKNIKVRKEGAVSQWIMAADLVIHDGCTTAIESFLAEVPVINYKSLKDYPWEAVLPNQFGIQCKTEDEVVKAVNDLDKDSEAFVKMNSLTPLTLSLMRNLQVDLYDEFVEFCGELIKQKMNKKLNNREISLQTMRFREIKHSLMLFCTGAIRIFSYVKRMRRSVGKVFFPGFSRNLVEEKVRAIENVLQKKVSLKYLSDRLFVVTSKDEAN